MDLDVSQLINQYDSKEINLSLLEIGCKPDGKRSQLKKKRQLFLKNLNYSFSLNIYRGLAHYHPESFVKLEDDPYEVDYMIICKDFSDDMFNFSDADTLELSKHTNKEISKRFLEKILQNKRRDFHKFMRSCKKDQYGSLRGKIGEMIMHKYIINNKPETLKYYSNAITNFTDDNYYKGTEVDGMFIFEKKNNFIDFLDELNKKKNLEVIINGRFSNNF